LAELWPDFREQALVYEDEDLIVVDKPAGVPSQAADASHDDDLPTRLRRWLAARRGVRVDDVYLGTHQRLDRDTSGLVLYTLRREANAAIAAQFEGRTVKKTYLAAALAPRALSDGAERVLEDFLARGRDGRMEVVTERTRGARAARTRVRVQQRVGERALLELGCDTGRTHQLRVQLAHAGAPIAGDRLYGGTKALRLLLHAARLELRHPRDGRALVLEAPKPPELAHWLAHGPVDASSDAALLGRALELALEQRYRLGRARSADAPTTAFRLFHRAGDGADGLAVDMYGDFLVAHFFDAMSEAGPADEARVLDLLETLGLRGIYLKRHVKQKNELSDPRDARYAPALPVRGSAAPDELVIHEHGLPFGVRLGEGLRTGIFLDQRENRARVRALAQGKRVLNLFAYTGGFSLAALAGGAAHALCVDASGSALAWAERNVARLDLEQSQRHRVLCSDVFAALAAFARRGERFDLIVVDPPSYSTTRKRRFVVHKDYEALCEACLAVLAPEGQMLCCINHHGVSQAKLRHHVRQAAKAAGRAVRKLHDLPAQSDFPAEQGAEPHSKSVLLACE
jgi:23S rRNA (cytosine1962-C5)-methyltransferase